MSRRPTATTLGRSSGRLSNTVGRPSGSLAVVTRPRGLWNSHRRVGSLVGRGWPVPGNVLAPGTLTTGAFRTASPLGRRPSPAIVVTTPGGGGAPPAGSP